MEKDPDVRTLFARYRSGHTSPQEETQLMELIRNGEQQATIHALITDALASPDRDGTISDEAVARVTEEVYAEIHRINTPKPVSEPDYAPPRGQPTFRWWAWSAAAATLIVVGCWGIVEYLDRPTLVTLSVPYGKTYTVMLPDSSTAALNGGSTIRYRKPFESGRRRVILTKGQVFFNVRKNPDLPFVVETSDLDVTVLGTAFEVRSFNDEKESRVSVITGQVSVTKRESPVDTSTMLVVSAQQQLVYDREHNSATLHAVADEFIAPWRSNQLKYRNERLDIVLRDIARKRKTPIRIENPNLGEQLFSGNLGNDVSLSQALEHLSLVAKYRLHFERDTLVIR